MSTCSERVRALIKKSHPGRDCTEIAGLADEVADLEARLADARSLLYRWTNVISGENLDKSVLAERSRDWLAGKPQPTLDALLASPGFEEGIKAAQRKVEAELAAQEAPFWGPQPAVDLSSAKSRAYAVEIGREARAKVETPTPAGVPAPANPPAAPDAPPDSCDGCRKCCESCANHCQLHPRLHTSGKGKCDDCDVTRAPAAPPAVPEGWICVGDNGCHCPRHQKHAAPDALRCHPGCTKAPEHCCVENVCNKANEPNAPDALGEAIEMVQGQRSACDREHHGPCPEDALLSLLHQARAAHAEEIAEWNRRIAERELAMRADRETARRAGEELAAARAEVEGLRKWRADVLVEWRKKYAPDAEDFAPIQLHDLIERRIMLEKERDAALARADRAERERDALRADLDQIEARVHSESGASTVERVLEVVGERDALDADAADLRASLAAAQEREGKMREALDEYDRKLKEVWGIEENPHAVAYGWTKLLRDDALSQPAPAVPEAAPRPGEVERIKVKP